MRADFGSSALLRIQRLEKKGVVLSTAQKILLAEIGTVEQVLSIITGSPVQVNVEKQSEKNGIIKREALITSESGRPLIRARSRIYSRNLPLSVVKKIRCKKDGIGTAIVDAGLETYRKITRIGVDKGGVPYRSYRIFYRKRVVFEIREEVLLKDGPGGI